MWLTKAMFFFLSFFFVARQKTGKLVTRDSSCTEMHFVNFLSGPMLKIVFYFFLIHFELGRDVLQLMFLCLHFMHLDLSK